MTLHSKSKYPKYFLFFLENSNLPQRSEECLLFYNYILPDSNVLNKEFYLEK